MVYSLKRGLTFQDNLWVSGSVGRKEVRALEKGAGVACQLFCLCLKTRNNLNLTCQ